MCCSFIMYKIKIMPLLENLAKTSSNEQSMNFQIDIMFWVHVTVKLQYGALLGVLLPLFVIVISKYSISLANLHFWNLKYTCQHIKKYICGSASLLIYLLVHYWQYLARYFCLCHIVFNIQNSCQLCLI